MSRARASCRAFAEKPLLLGLGFVAVQAALIPLEPGGALVAPDLLYCLIVAWVIRRPARDAALGGRRCSGSSPTSCCRGRSGSARSG